MKEKAWILVLVLFAGLVIWGLASSMCGPIPCDPEDPCYREAYLVGRSEGWDSGYDYGYDAGYDAGYERGQVYGWDQGSEYGYGEGYDDGKVQGYQTGYDWGYSDCYHGDDYDDFPYPYQSP